MTAWGRYGGIMRGFLPVLLGLLMIAAEGFAQQGELRVIHLSPDAPDIDIYVGDETTPSISFLTFGSASAALTQAAGNVDIRITPAGLPNFPVASQSVPITADRRLNIHAFNALASIEAIATTFDLNAPTSPDSASLRIVHASPDQGNVDVHIIPASGEPLVIPGLPFKAVTPFYSLPSGPVTVAIFEAGTDTKVLSAEGNLSGSSYGTLYVSGFAEELQLQVLDETSTNAQDPMTTLVPVVAAEETTVRFVHVVPEGPAVDVFLGEETTPLIANLGPRDASANLTLETGVHNLKAAPTGLGPDFAVVDFDHEFHADTAYTLLALGDIDEQDVLEMTLTRDPVLVPPSGKTLVRFLHGAYPVGDIKVVMTSETGTQFTLPFLDFTTVSGFFEFPTEEIFVDIFDLSDGKRFFSGSVFLPEEGVVTLIANGNPAKSDFVVNMLVENVEADQRPMVALTSQVEPTFFRAVHLSGDAGPAEVFIDDERFDGLTYGGATGRSEMDAGFYNIKVAAEGEGIGNAVIDTDIELPGNTYRVFMIVGEKDKQTISGVPIDADPVIDVSQGTTALRFFHASPDAGPLDVTVQASDNSTTPFSNLTYKAGTGYLTLPSGEATVTVRTTAATGNVLRLIAEGELSDGEPVTAIVSGTVADNSLSIHLLRDADGAAQKPMVLLERTSVSVDEPATGGGVVTALLPNPVSAETRLRYELSERADVGIDIYNAGGERVFSVEEGFREAGRHESILSVSGLPSGFYTVLLRDGVENEVLTTSRMRIVR